MYKALILLLSLLVLAPFAYAQPVVSGHILMDEGVRLRQEPFLDFVGSSVDCVSDPVLRKTTCTFTGGGGSGSGTVDTGLTGNPAYYAADGTTVHPTTGMAFDATSVVAVNRKTTTITNANVTLGAHNVVLMSTGNTNRTATLPDAATATYNTYVIIKSDGGTGTVTLAAAGADTVNGGASLAVVTLQHDAYIVQKSGTTTWQAISVVHTVSLTSGVSGILPIANGGTGASTLAFTASNLVPALTTRPVNLNVGCQNCSPIVDADLGPQMCKIMIPYDATILELYVRADAGTPSVIVGRRRGNTVVNITTSALATGAAGAAACAQTAAGTSLDGTTTCVATLQNTDILKGDCLELVSGTATGGANFMLIEPIIAQN